MTSSHPNGSEHAGGGGDDRALAFGPPWPLYVLAGGKSSRFGSDKARAMMNGTALLARVCEAFAPITNATVVVAGRDDAYQDLMLTTIGDATPGLGPLGGLATALRHAEAQNHDWVLLASCDLVHPHASSVVHLASRVEPDRHVAVVYQNEQGWFEPFPGLYRVKLLSQIEALLNGRDRSMQHFLRILGDGVFSSTEPAGPSATSDADRPSDIADVTDQC